MSEHDPASEVPKGGATLDEDFVLALSYAPTPERRRLSALYRLAAELRRIPQIVSEPQLGEIRLQWWREALGEMAAGNPPRGHPALAGLEAAGGVDQAFLATGERGLEGEARFLYPETAATPDALFEAFAEAEGWLARLATDNAGTADALADLAGAYGLARWGRQAAARLSQGLDWPAAAALAREKRAAGLARLGGAAPPDIAARILYTALAEGYLRRAEDAPWPAMKRLVLFRAMATGGL